MSFESEHGVGSEFSFTFKLIDEQEVDPDIENKTN
jgi:hypothetical protein